MGLHPSLGGQRGRSCRSRDARCVGRDAGGELDNVDKALPSNSAIVNGALALHGAILVLANVVALLVGISCDGGFLALDLPLQLEELLGVQTDDARMGLWCTARSALVTEGEPERMLAGVWVVVVVVILK